jgi:hypothetical protein
MMDGEIKWIRISNFNDIPIKIREDDRFLCLWEGLPAVIQSDLDKYGW